MFLFIVAKHYLRSRFFAWFYLSILGWRQPYPESIFGNRRTECLVLSCLHRCGDWGKHSTRRMDTTAVRERHLRSIRKHTLAIQWLLERKGCLNMVRREVPLNITRETSKGSKWQSDGKGQAMSQMTAVLGILPVPTGAEIGLCLITTASTFLICTFCLKWKSLAKFREDTEDRFYFKVWGHLYRELATDLGFWSVLFTAH